MKNCFQKTNNAFEFISLLLEVNDTTIESVYKSVNKTNINTAYEVLEFGLIIRYLNTKHILALLDLLSAKFGYERDPNDYIKEISEIIILKE